ncbi:MAG TPA: TRAP transporter large permease subunit, partial [Syntrophorhabdus sp.]|nr:TRAP transporter large permease subunit [Syntrophorhabdus sp.]
GSIFLAGLIPGVLLLVLTWWWGIRSDPSTYIQEALSGTKALKAVLQAKWELLLPVVALVSLFSGIATPVEAAAFTALYALIIEVCVYRDLKFFRDVPRVMVGVVFLLAVFLLFLVLPWDSPTSFSPSAFRKGLWNGQKIPFIPSGFFSSP